MINYILSQYQPQHIANNTYCVYEILASIKKDFYIKHGYEVFGVLDDCPKGHKRYFFNKIFNSLSLPI